MLQGRTEPAALQALCQISKPTPSQVCQAIKLETGQRCPHLAWNCVRTAVNNLSLEGIYYPSWYNSRFAMARLAEIAKLDQPSKPETAHDMIERAILVGGEPFRFRVEAHNAGSGVMLVIVRV